MKNNYVRPVKSPGKSSGWEAVFDRDSIQSEISELEAQMSRPDFWNEQSRAQKVSRELKWKQELLNQFERLETRSEDLVTLLEMAEEEKDETAAQELDEELETLKKDVDSFFLQQAFSGEHDSDNAFLSVHPGAGGTESCDWAQMLLRMYMRWCERNGYATETVEFLPGDEAGIKSVTVLVKGEWAYGYLHPESGVHRLVRISPFDANKRRHTSFASVFIMPELDDEVEIEINDDDLRVDTFHSSGAGGQHVNVTDSAVRMTHLPTGIVVSCQNERSQHKNRAMALKVLRARLYELKQREKMEKIEAFGAEKKEIRWGNQVRSYVFCPYQMVKDHRTNHQTGNVDAVMDGDLNDFIEASLRQKVSEK